METFHSIQGEGFHSGKPAYFIRIGGCDVGCHWCDVKESWDENDHPTIPVKEIVKKSVGFSDCVVVTGGEPLMWNMNPLTKALKKSCDDQNKGITTFIEIILNLINAKNISVKN